MSKQVDITKSLSEVDANYLVVFERHADIRRAKALGTWPEGFKGTKVEEEPEEAEEGDPGDTNVPEQGDDETNGDYAARLTVPQLRELIEAYGNEEEQLSAPAKSADKGKVKAHAILILDRIDRETLEAQNQE